MKVDALIVGAGPAGSYTALRLAQYGHRVLVCEEHAVIGQPVHCTGVLSAGSFDEFDLPRDAIQNPLHTVRFVSPSGREVVYSPPALQAVVIDRARFDAGIAARAAAAGADVRLNARVTAIEPGPDGLRVSVGHETIAARLVVLACGASYGLQRRLGLGLPRAHLLTAQRELPAGRLGDVEVHFGSAIAPGGFAWAVPIDRPDGPHVRIGLMASGRAAGWYHAMVARLAARWGLDRIPEGRPRLKFLPLRAVTRTYADRVLAVGDAAGLVKPTTGGGIYYSVLSASLAADVGAEALTADRLHAAALSVYQSRWRRRLAAEFQAQWLMRLVARRMSDRQIDALFDLAHTDGIMPIVHRTAEFNQHRRFIHAILRHAPARRVFWPDGI
jgi:geranylgeranyl reductase family protein